MLDKSNSVGIISAKPTRRFDTIPFGTFLSFVVPNTIIGTLKDPSYITLLANNPKSPNISPWSEVIIIIVLSKSFSSLTFL